MWIDLRLCFGMGLVVVIGSVRVYKVLVSMLVRRCWSGGRWWDRG